MKPIDALVVLQRSDVDHLQAHAAEFAAVPLLFTDPGIMDAAVQAGLGNYELRRIDVGRDISALAYSQAVHLAAAIDLQLTALRQAHWGSAGASRSDSPFHGWDQGLLYLTLQRAATQRAIGLAIARQFPERRLGLLRPDNPALFNWDSMLSTEVVAGNDPARWRVVGSYPQGRYWQPALLNTALDAAALTALTALAHPQVQALTHIATCFYDVRTFSDAITQRFAHSIDLPGLYCDIPVRRAPGGVLAQVDDGIAARLDPRVLVYREQARQVFTLQLAGLIPHQAALALQADAFARRCAMQALSFLALRQAMAGTQPHIVVADHDIGLNGPLFSLAHELDCPVTVLPHSAYTTNVLPHARRVTAIERDGVGVPARTVLGQPVATRAVRFRPSLPPAARPQARQVCLLLNTMLSEGLSYVELFALIGLYRALAAVCARHGRELVVRLKPSTPALGVVSAALGMPAAYFARTMALSIDEVARQADITLAFGEPTSATINFFDAGSLMLHVSEQDWPADYICTTPLKGAVMPSLRCAAAVAEVDALLGDASLYSAAQSSQAARYAARRVGAVDTIFDPAPADPKPLPAHLPITPVQELATC